MKILRPLKSISFYTTCKERLNHLSQTLPYNIALCQRILNRVVPFEIVVLNYNSQDNLESWIYEHCLEAIHYKQLKLYHTNKPSRFHMAHAKNMAARCCQNEILVNLDSDHFLSTFYLYALTSWRKNSILEVDHLNGYIDGSRGRIAMEREAFFELGGYDEMLNTHWGGDDDDLLLRAAYHGLHRRKIQAGLIGQILQHSDVDRLSYSHEVVDTREPISTEETLDKIVKKIEQGLLIANQGRDWGTEASWDTLGISSSL
jgi:hypothetical protein